MKDYNIIITIGTDGDNEDMAMDKVNRILRFVQTELPNKNYKIEIKEQGQYIG